MLSSPTPESADSDADYPVGLSAAALLSGIHPPSAPSRPVGISAGSVGLSGTTRAYPVGISAYTTS